ncbi:hypothetical protein SADUNF_Sadunf06G0094000 [Salix dunnii]|uniref:Uncharacterized protein n=1 Tax=Salix dunnii TaxID=1413687 RepID=A0A835K6C9_9ROSI|nr:hypothetical protein SADUNF_Sadunf06G0094000 [Salix dunnii]
MKATEFYDAMNREFLPVFRLVDPQGMMRSMEHDMGRAIIIIFGLNTKSKKGPCKISYHNVNIFALIKHGNTYAFYRMLLKENSQLKKKTLENLHSYGIDNMVILAEWIANSVRQENGA